MNTSSVTHIRLAVINYPGSQLSAVYGLADLLHTANRYTTDLPNFAQITVETLSHPDEISSQKYTAIIFPPSLNGVGKEAENNLWIDWIKQQHTQGTVLCSVCAGAFLLARTGLLDGRPATTHWELAEAFSSEFSKVKLNIDKILIDDGDLITAGGLMAWLDLGLRLTERFLGPSAMRSTARAFLIDPGGREQRFYSSFSPSFSHGDNQVIKVQQWLQANSHKEVSIAELATQANLSERTLLRRFKKATEQVPSEYLQHLRVEKAREQLELTNTNIETIAWEVGYQDVNSFRRVFQKIIGLSPREYRNRFSGMST